MTTLKTVDEVTRTIEYEMQVNNLWKEDRVGFSGFTIDGLLTVAGIIKKDRQSHCDELVRLLEAKKAPVPLGVSKSPEANIGIGSYNQAIDQALTIVKEVYKSK